MRASPLLLAALVLGCTEHPGWPDKQVGFRTPHDDGPTSGERGQVVFSEVLWSGSVRDDGTRDQSDVFIELRNEGHRPLNLSHWHIELHGAITRTFRLPATDEVLHVGMHTLIAAKADGCFLEPDFVVRDLVLPDGDPFFLVLRDADLRLIDQAGSSTMPPFAGGYDLVTSRSMERLEIMFGGRGTHPHMWHFYTEAPVDVPNDDRIAEGCRAFTKASPGRPNSPDYSGAYASGSFE